MPGQQLQHCRRGLPKGGLQSRAHGPMELSAPAGSHRCCHQQSDLELAGSCCRHACLCHNQPSELTAITDNRASPSGSVFSCLVCFLVWLTPLRHCYSLHTQMQAPQHMGTSGITARSNCTEHADRFTPSTSGITNSVVSGAEDCDEDIQEYCQDSMQGSRSGVWGIGAAGRCLSKQLAEGQYVDAGCKKLVLAAAPKV